MHPAQTIPAYPHSHVDAIRISTQCQAAFAVLITLLKLLFQPRRRHKRIRHPSEPVYFSIMPTQSRLSQPQKRIGPLYCPLVQGQRLAGGGLLAILFGKVSELRLGARPWSNSFHLLYWPPSSTFLLASLGRRGGIRGAKFVLTLETCLKPHWTRVVWSRVFGFTRYKSSFQYMTWWLVETCGATVECFRFAVATD